MFGDGTVDGAVAVLIVVISFVCGIVVAVRGIYCCFVLRCY